MPVLGRIESIWRYPIKSLRAEELNRTAVAGDGLAGDRTSALYVESGSARVGKPYRGKENSRLHTTDRVDRARTFAPGIVLDYRAEADERYFDAAPVSLLFDRWLDELSVLVGYALEPLRFRPNIFARAQNADLPNETALIGSALQVGEVRLQVRSGIQRCVTPTYDIQTGEPDPRVLRAVAQHRGNLMGVYCDVLQSGEIRTADAVVRL
ncbi:MAG: MOSC domain-containing protein [Candidatus Eremiobacteraeota bacterium]|nr:MOSC domain-containing protein [Candidatus Eremiobacteraeota bacterium]